MNIQNLTNSPYDLRLADGSKERLPARGSLEGVDVHPHDLQHLKACGYIRVSAGAKTAKPWEQEPETVSLEDQYFELTGERPDGRWGEDRLAAEVESLKGGEDG